MTMENRNKHQSKKSHTGPDRTAEYPVSRLSPPIELVDLAAEIQQADRFIDTAVSAKLQVIADQIKGLQEKARTILEAAGLDQELHRVRCSFTKKPGRIYYLYEKQTGRLYFSMLSPAEWNDRPPHPFKGAYRLEPDMSWTRMEP